MESRVSVSPGRQPIWPCLSHLSVLTLVLPNYTSTIPGPVYSASQLAFVSTVTLALYGVFLYIQTVRHRDYFIELRSGEKARGRGSPAV